MSWPWSVDGEQADGVVGAAEMEVEVGMELTRRWSGEQVAGLDGWLPHSPQYVCVTNGNGVVTSKLAGSLRYQLEGLQPCRCMAGWLPYNPGVTCQLAGRPCHQRAMGWLPHKPAGRLRYQRVEGRMARSQDGARSGG